MRSRKPIANSVHNKPVDHINGTKVNAKLFFKPSSHGFKLDVARLDAPSIRRYCRRYRLDNNNRNKSREDALRKVEKHYDGMDVDEEETILGFLYHIRTMGKNELMKDNSVHLPINERKF